MLKNRMRKLMHIYLLCLVLFTTGGWAFAQPTPNRVDFEDLSSTIKNSSVIIFGENHSAWMDNQHYPLIVKEIMRLDPTYNCIALELSASLQSEFDQIQGPADYPHFFLQYLLKIPFYTDLYNSKSDVEKEQFLKAFVFLNSPWIDASLVIKKSGGKAFLMDDLSQLSSDVVSSMVFRNEMMGKAVTASLTNKKCTKVIMINGAEHISTWHGLNLFDFLPGQNALGFLLSDVYLPDSRTIRINVQERLK